MIIKQSQNPESIGDSYKQWGSQKWEWLKFIVAANEGQNSLEFLRWRGATEASFSSREQIVASIFISLFWRQYLAFSDWFMTFFTLDVAAKF